MSLLYSRKGFERDVADALGDSQLRGALRHAVATFTTRRQGAVDAMPRWEAMRERARAIKAETLLHLDRYLERFVERAEAAGATVHWARDAAEANAIVGKIARDRGARRLVKGKSMVTEEIDLNAALLRADGVEPVETDLGEWIIQLAGEKPSHIIAPAIHKTRGQIADLFVEKIGIEKTDDIGELTAAARRMLRRHFAEADLGVSGVNFAVAETGTILVLENEGNIRMSTSLPRVRVAVMGIEKLIPRHADLELFLRLLPRSGTGQHLTSYQSLITGVVDRVGGEGPREVHVVLLDNGRAAMLAEEVTRQSLACIRCGACLTACPVYNQIGGHAYGSVYPGPIGAILTPQLAGLEPAAQLPFASSLCGACRDVCPVKIDIPRLLLDRRAKVNATKAAPGGRLERVGFRAWAWAMTSPARYRFAARLARALPWAGRWRMRAWTSTRVLPPLAKRSFRERWSELERPGDAP
jgi:L-lactate dehydrogenase complex protein LldF